jgi:hypothetical protein
VTLGVPTEASAYMVDDGGMANLDELEYLPPKEVNAYNVGDSPW